MVNQFCDWQQKIHCSSSRFRGFSHYYQLTWARLNVTGVHMKRDLLWGSSLVGNTLSVAWILSKDSWILLKKNKISKASKLGRPRSRSKLMLLLQFLPNWLQCQSCYIKFSPICYRIAQLWAPTSAGSLTIKPSICILDSTPLLPISEQHVLNFGEKTETLCKSDLLKEAKRMQ